MSEKRDTTGLLDRIYSSRIYRAGTLLGLAVALVTAPLALPPVQTALFGRHAAVTVEVEREVPAYDVNEKFPDLTVLYKGRDLTAENVVLALARIRIFNSGNISISESNISRTDPLGVEISNAAIVGVLNATASSDHLSRRARPSANANAVRIPNNIIMDPKDFVQFDLLLLRKRSDVPQFTPLGKVEGLKRIDLKRNDPSAERRPFVWRVFEGDTGVQATRLIAYFIFGLLIIAFIAAIAIQIGDIRSRLRERRRRELCGRVRPLLTDVDADLWLVVSNVYRVSGLAGLRAFDRHLSRSHADPAGASLKAASRRIPAPEPPQRKGESKARYMKKVLDRNVRQWFLGTYVSVAAAQIGVDFSSAEVRAAAAALIIRFERIVDEVAADAGIKPHALENEQDSLTQDLVSERVHSTRVVEPRVKRPDQKDGR